jgi:hypothetical protein
MMQGSCMPMHAEHQSVSGGDSILSSVRPSTDPARQSIRQSDSRSVHALSLLLSVHLSVCLSVRRSTPLARSVCCLSLGMHPSGFSEKVKH